MTHLWRALHEAERRRVGKDPHPSAAIMGSQSVKTVEESAHIRGFDAHKCVKGRKRHLLVDTLGLSISIYVMPADMHDTPRARRLLAGLKFFVPRLKQIWADVAYRGKELAGWCLAEGDWDVEVVECTLGVRGFAVLPKRWIVERTFGWLSRNRRMSKEYERNAHRGSNDSATDRTPGAQVVMGSKHACRVYLGVGGPMGRPLLNA